MDFSALFELRVAPLELIVRATVVYWFLFLVFRFVQQRGVGGVGIADILLLVLIADAAQNAMVGVSHSVSEGLLVVSTLLAWNWLLDSLAFHYRPIARFVNHPPTVLIRRGVVQSRALRSQLLSIAELQAQLRLHGIEKTADVELATLEEDGRISVIAKHPPSAQTATDNDSRPLAS